MPQAFIRTLILPAIIEIIPTAIGHLACCSGDDRGSAAVGGLIKTGRIGPEPCNGSSGCMVALPFAKWPGPNQRVSLLLHLPGVQCLPMQPSRDLPGHEASGASSKADRTSVIRRERRILR